MKTNQENIIISEGHRALWQTIIAAIFYTITLGLILFMLFVLYVEISERSLTSCIGVLSFAMTHF